MSERRHRQQYQPTLPGLSDRIRSGSQASVVVGDFFESLTASMVGGKRLTVDQQAGDNPDVEAPNGRFYESKGSGKYRWVVSVPQFENMLKLDGWYMLWDYAKTPHPMSGFKDCEALQAWLAKNVRGAYVFPATLLRDLIAGTSHPDVVDSSWGANYLVSKAAIRRLGFGTHRLQPRLIVQARHREGIHARGQDVVTHVAHWAKYREDVDRVRHTHRRGWIATEDDVSYARLALAEMEQHRLAVVLVPAPRPKYHGHKVRAVQSHNPRWYRALADRRPNKSKGAHSIRQYVERALRSIIATGYIRPSPKAMDLEVLEMLHEDQDFGTGRTAAP